MCVLQNETPLNPGFDVPVYTANQINWSVVNGNSFRYKTKIDSRYTFAVILISGDRNTINSSSNWAMSYDAAFNKAITNIKASNWYDKSSKYVIITAEQYNIIVENAKNGNSGVPINMSNSLALPSNKTLADKLVHVVWNQTTGTFVKANETEAEALATAELESRKNPINSYLVLSPSKRVYQPVNIQVESLTAGSVQTVTNTNYMPF